MRGLEPVALSDRQFDVLLLLVSRSGQIVSKDALIEAAWRDVAVGDNSLEQVISALRRLLGPAPDGSPYIETLARRGYRFRTTVTRAVTRQTDDALEALLAPYRAFVEGRAAVETLERDAVLRAQGVFGEGVAASPDFASGHVGLATALALGFEATRAGDAPDVPALRAAIHHAREGCRLDAASGETWATLAFVLSLTGAHAEAVAAGRRAIALEPDNWRHYVRLAFVAWGEERLRAAHQAVRRLPGLALAHWLAATVHVARQTLEEAERELAAGVEAQDRQQERGKFGGVGLHLLWGLVHLARGDESAAEEAFARELAFEPVGRIYTRQACANAWYALGAIRLRHAKTDEAAAAFGRALDRVPGHALALAAMSAAGDVGHRSSATARLDRRLAVLRTHGASVEVAMASGVREVLAGRHARAASLIHAALRAAPSGSSGWTVPVEPVPQVGNHTDDWAKVFATLRARAA